MKRLTFVLAAILLLALPSQAGPPLNSQPNVRTAFFDPAPGAVAVDVWHYETSTMVGNGLAASLGPTGTQVWQYDLSTIGNYPGSCIPATYQVMFKPDGANCTTAAVDCAYDTVQVGGSACLTSSAVVTPSSPTSTYATSVQATQGITSQTLDFYRVKGLHPVQWVQRDYSAGYDFQNPDTTDWEVYYYETIQSFPSVKCTVFTTTDPSTSLPTTCL